MIIIFFLLCAIIGGYTYLTDSRRVREMAEAYLSNMLGGRVEIGQATLSIFEGLTLEEAAQRTGETLAAIRHHYYRGLMKLREFISSNKRSRQQNDTEAIALEAAHLKPRPI